MDRRFYNDFLTDYRDILRRFQGSFTQANCTALACAVDNYFSTGEVRRVSGFSSGGFEQIGGTPLRRSTLSHIVGRVNQGSNGYHLVIEAESSSRHHFANLIKINGEVYYVDGFNRSQPVCTPNITGYLNWANVFHYSIGLRVRLTP